MDQCGGFIVNDTRETKDVGSMKYLKTNKPANMWNFVSTQLNVEKHTVHPINKSIIKILIHS